MIPGGARVKAGKALLLLPGFVDVFAKEKKLEETLGIYAEYPRSQSLSLPSDRLLRKAKELYRLGRHKECIGVLNVLFKDLTSYPRLKHRSNLSKSDANTVRLLQLAEALILLDKNLTWLGVEDHHATSAVRDAIRIFTSLGDEEQAAFQHSTLAWRFIERAQYGLAKAEIMEGFRKNERAKSKVNRRFLLDARAGLAAKVGHVTKASALFEDVLDLDEVLYTSPSSVALAVAGRSIAAARSLELRVGGRLVHEAEKAIEYCQADQNLGFEMQILEQLFQYHRDRGDLEASASFVAEWARVAQREPAEFPLLRRKLDAARILLTFGRRHQALPSFTSPVKSWGFESMMEDPREFIAEIKWRALREYIEEFLVAYESGRFLPAASALCHAAELVTYALMEMSNLPTSNGGKNLTLTDKNDALFSGGIYGSLARRRFEEITSARNQIFHGQTGTPIVSAFANPYSLFELAVWMLELMKEKSIDSFEPAITPRMRQMLDFLSQDF